jgi:cobalt/nickel transport system permease protein
MHIPDGFLSTFVSIILWVVTAVVVGYALRRVGKDLGERQVPMVGVLAAAIFAGQMLNFTVAGGTSGHLMGAALATILLGPWAAIIVMTTVVGVQAIIFQDGGLLVLGANIFNMGIIGVLVSYFVYRSFKKLAGRRSWGIFVGGFTAAWFSIVITALAVALQLAFSGVSPANISIPAMGGIHMLIGIGEGLITIGALAFLFSTRRDLLPIDQAGLKGGRAVWISGLILAAILAVVSPLASVHPDGLEWVAEQRGFLDLAQEPLYKIIPDYVFPGISNEALATIVAGIIGVVIVLVVALSATFFQQKKKASH